MKALLLLMLPLGGCAVVSDLSGLAVGGAAGGVTANPVVGYVVGVGVRAGVDELQRYVVRRRQQGEQDAIAEAAGNALPGQPQAWEIRHTLPIGNEHGTLTAIRDVTTPIATCREVLFKVDDGGLFATSICHQQDGWKWAAAEPAVERWGFLQ